MVIEHVAHKLAVGQQVTVSGSNTFSGLLDADINATHTIIAIKEANVDASDAAEVTGADFYTVDLQALPTTDTKNGGGGNVHIDAVAGMQAETNSRSLAWAMLDVLRNSTYAAGIADRFIDFDSFAFYNDVWLRRQEFFDYYIDRKRGWIEVINAMAKVGRAAITSSRGRFSLVRDEQKTVLTAAFSPRNIVKDTFAVTYQMIKPGDVDGSEVEYTDERAYKMSRIIGTYEDTEGVETTPLNPQVFKAEGVVQEFHAHRLARYLSAAVRYRRIHVSIRTEYEGFIPNLFDHVSVTHPMPGWGQAGDLIEYVETGPADAPYVRCAEPLNWDHGPNQTPGDLGIFEDGVDPMWTARGDGAIVAAHNDVFRRHTYEGGVEGADEP